MKFFEIEGKKYIMQHWKHKDGTDTVHLVPYNEEEYKSVVKDIIKITKKAVNAEKVLEAALANLEYDQILKIHKLLKKGARVKPVHGCFELEIGEGKDYKKRSFISIVP